MLCSVMIYDIFCIFFKTMHFSITRIIICYASSKSNSLSNDTDNVEYLVRGTRDNIANT